jgi:hypothetical protein
VKTTIDPLDHLPTTAGRHSRTLEYAVFLLAAAALYPPLASLLWLSCGPAAQRLPLAAVLLRYEPALFQVCRMIALFVFGFIVLNTRSGWLSYRSPALRLAFVTAGAWLIMFLTLYLTQLRIELFF